MPKKTNFRKLVKKQIRRKARRAARNSGLSLGRYTAMLSGFPSQKIVKMRYVDRYQNTLNGAGYGLVQWRANGCFDPDVTGTGHQPLGYDQWS